MAQEIKIPVSAQTEGAVSAGRKLAETFDQAGAAAASIAKGARDASAAVRTLADDTRRLAAARDLLSRELGRDVGEADTSRFLDNFDRLRRSRAGARSMRGFNDFEGWYYGHSGVYRTPAEAARHRRWVMATSMQGTADQRANGAPGGLGDEEAGGGGGGGGGGRGGGSDFNRGARRAGSMAMGFTRSALALAGVGLGVGILGKAGDLAAEEATGVDTLKRRLGDVGVQFERLRDQARRAGEGLGVTFVESQRFARAYTAEVGNMGRTDLAGDGLTGRLRTAYGFARSYGVDPGDSTQFFSQMAARGVGRDESGQRRFALLIGDAVARSGYGGKVEELLRAVADYAAVSARMTLTAPNASAFANALTSLTSSGRPGLNPSEAAALLSTADSAVRRGGAMGEASMSFSYAALRNASPGINPMQAMALMEGGLFGTTDGVFGAGSPLSRYMGRPGGPGGQTNFDKMMPLMRRHYGSGGYFLNAVKNHFGLSSHAQAAALADMSDKGLLGATSRVLDGSGIDPMSLSATGFSMVGQLANAGGGKLRSLYADIANRKDISPAQRQALLAAGAVGGSDEDVRRSMIQAVSKLGIAQEKTTGTETRDSLVSINNALTQAGGPVLTALNGIRGAVTALAEKFIPGYMDTTGTVPIGQEAWAGGNLGEGKGNPQRAPLEKDAMAFFMGKGWTKTQAAGIVGNAIRESNLSPTALNPITKSHRGMFQWDKARWGNLVNFAKKRGLDPNDPKTQMEFFHFELTDGEEWAAGNFLRKAKTPHEATLAVMRSERPEQYQVGAGDGYNSRIKEYGPRAAHAARLASEEATPAPARGGGNGKTEVTGAVDVNIYGPDGKMQTVKVPLTSAAGKAVAAGRKRTPGLSTPR